ncbi:hypothetical protein PC9H_004770 [Pleurotus ostreatus]|uniref:DUF6534 domain-containing protein n=1 Tax=Pleurotus ostreatus TaxID=5322 RepID=A0A8H7A2K2_PLEOS|nr:uncharacterized protein PC9H_004770 [Pleurotus ostreatus]KAF7432827.1 hypothetical protein PC9H_004770 [Pleurotus ostreatus]
MSSPLSIDNTMGAALIGSVCAAVLYGVSCIQTWYYYDRYPTDAWYIKYLVASVWVFDTIHQVLISHTVYHYLVSNYTNPAMLANIIWLSLICLLVQGFLTMRVWRMSNKNKILTFIVLCLVIAEFGMMQLQTWLELSQLKGLSMAVNVLAAAGDALIAASLVFLLRRSRTGFKKSDTMISRLIVFTVNTGLFTSICAVMSLVSIIVWGNTLIYVAFYFSLGRLYSNSLLATLNARQEIRNLADEMDTLSLSFRSGPSSFGSGSKKPTNISIVIDTTQDFVRDRAMTMTDSETESPITDLKDEV